MCFLYGSTAASAVSAKWFKMICFLSAFFSWTVKKVLVLLCLIWILFQWVLLGEGFLIEGTADI